MHVRSERKLAALLRWADWDTPPAQMECALPFRQVVERILECLDILVPCDPATLSADPPAALRARDAAVELYILVPALVNVLLNYKICVEHDLPLHPTVYYELREARKYRMRHALGDIQKANEWYWQSMDVARKAYSLSVEAPAAIRAFSDQLPSELQEFVYTAVRDKYTWLGSNPSLLASLAARIEHFHPELLLAAAHGSIMPGLMLAEMLEIPLYFIRFSMFKRYDEEPIVSLSDQAWLFDYRNARVVLYDEDVAGGRTLELFSKRLSHLFAHTVTACSLHHAGASIQPDICGKTWWD